MGHQDVRKPTAECHRVVYEVIESGRVCNSLDPSNDSRYGTLIPCLYLLIRLIHYFDGQHHVEEILFREQIVAKDLRTVLSAFREFLILAWA